MPDYKEPDASTIEHARSLDEQDPLRHFRAEFIIPSKADLTSPTLETQQDERSSSSSRSSPSTTTSSSSSSSSPDPSSPCIYLCGNSLGLQPRRTSALIQTHLSTWAKKGVYGHFTKMADSPLPPFMNADEVVAEQMATIVGARPDEVAIMQTLTANLHLMMMTFYRPTKDRYKILLEGKAFPSDHYAVESQIRLHDLDPDEAMILIKNEDDDTSTSTSSSSSSATHCTTSNLTTQSILSTIDHHACSTALILLPGIQYYTGQYFDMRAITAHAHSKGIAIGWDLAHAVGNVPLQLHDWGMDFAVWCNYKYINGGPGVIGGLFVHERHGRVDDDAAVEDGGAGFKAGYRGRLTGWWGGDKSVRFRMENKFIPIPGAQGFQLSNPSIIDLTALYSSLSIFNRATISALREKSVRLTAYLEHLLVLLLEGPSAFASSSTSTSTSNPAFTIITPSEPSSRGAQLSIKLSAGLLESVMKHLEEKGVVVDERKPDVVRVAPAPLYNSFEDVCAFVKVFEDALVSAVRAGEESEKKEGAVMVDGGKEEKGWAGIK
ncbi:MAG: Kynureninase (L-kynurenine hydrolase) [Peltula sp. TS41687]|nr:MAG: Kynureninase (L-kynurenine hydrolase) [Peltula sp. TS41687]